LKVISYGPHYNTASMEESVEASLAATYSNHSLGVPKQVQIVSGIWKNRCIFGRFANKQCMKNTRQPSSDTKYQPQKCGYNKGPMNCTANVTRNPTKSNRGLPKSLAPLRPSATGSPASFTWKRPPKRRPPGLEHERQDLKHNTWSWKRQRYGCRDGQKAFPRNKQRQSNQVWVRPKLGSGMLRKLSSFKTLANVTLNIFLRQGKFTIWPQDDQRP